MKHTTYEFLMHFASPATQAVMLGLSIAVMGGIG